MKTDEDLKRDVITELSWNPLVPEKWVQVTVSEGVVTLTGTLDTYVQKVAAKRTVGRVGGVKAIVVELKVAPLDIDRRSDTDIAAAVWHVLSWSTSIPAGVKLTVENGWVTLSGELDWDFQRQAVERIARPLKGVVGITDNIQLKTLPTPGNLPKRIHDALTRQAMGEARRIKISVAGSVVTLRGHVHSWAERGSAEGTTWSAPGVSQINNQLTIDA
jgi:osmotically-inducible protein OsmY